MSQEPREHPEVKVGRFVAQWREEVASVTVRLRGWADCPEVAEALNALWMQVHTHALDLKAGHVLVDMRELEFISSSGYRTMVVWLSHLAEAKEGERYGIHFRVDSARDWQRRGPAALSFFARGLVTMEP